MIWELGPPTLKASTSSVGRTTGHGVDPEGAQHGRGGDQEGGELHHGGAHDEGSRGRPGPVLGRHAPCQAVGKAGRARSSPPLRRMTKTTTE